MFCSLRIFMGALAIKEQMKCSIEDYIIGNSPEVIALRNMIIRVAQSSASILISGPSGAGKELVARAIHDHSARSCSSFVALNCGAIPSELIESELFGHERGSFTGAISRRIGRFEEADKGTLFLDEIGDMRFDMQVKLLRVLEDGMISRVGGTAALPVNVRIISATHQNIDDAILDGRFREDLFFRLGVVILRVPELAKRKADIPLLIAHFQSGKPKGATARFDASGIQRLMQHPWPGNIRELRNIVERSGVLFGGQILNASDVDVLLGKSAPKFTPVSTLRKMAEEAYVPKVLPCDILDPLAAADASRTPINLKDVLESMELERIQSALNMAEGVISEAARLLTLKRTTLIEKMRKYGVDKSC
jgi:sigma-54 dependent transcriptional regulator, flagellar regulatory protein